MSRPTPPTCKTRNWPAYNEALKHRGSLTIWFDPAMAWEAAPSGKCGDQRKWIARAVVSAAKSHVAFGLTLKEARQAERLLASTPVRDGLDWER